MALLINFLCFCLFLYPATTLFLNIRSGEQAKFDTVSFNLIKKNLNFIGQNMSSQFSKKNAFLKFPFTLHHYKRAFGYH